MIPLFAATLMTILAAAPVASAETLGDKLRDSGFERILGTWVDKDTKGEAFKTTYKWRLKDRVVEVMSESQEAKSIGFIAVSGESGEVVHAGADDKGGTGLGKWSVDEGDAVLEFLYVSEDGEETGVRIRHRFPDDDTMAVTMEIGGDSFDVTMVRKK